MANFDTIKTAIDANIKTNGTQDITGSKMNSILHQMVDATDEQLTELESEVVKSSNSTIFGEESLTIQDTYISETGVEKSYSGAIASDFIELPFGWKSLVILSKDISAIGVALYGNSKNFISNIPFDVVGYKDIDYNPQVRYIRFSKFASEGNPVIFVKTETLSEYKGDIVGKSIEGIKEQYVPISICKNAKKRILDDGSYTNDNYAFSSNIIRLPKGWKYIKINLWQGSLNAICLYDKNYNVVEYHCNEGKITIENVANAEYYAIMVVDKSANPKNAITIGYADVNDGLLITKDYNKLPYVDGLLNKYDISNISGYKTSDYISLGDWEYLDATIIKSSISGIVLYDHDKYPLKYILNTSPYTGVLHIERNECFRAAYARLSWGVGDEETITIALRNTHDRFFEKVEKARIYNRQKFVNHASEVVFSPQNTESAITRVPSIIENNGAIMAVCQAQQNTEDLGKMDIALRIYQNGSWDDVRKVLPYSTTYGRYMNPTLVKDNNGRIYLFVGTCKDDNSFAINANPSDLDMVYIYTDNNGDTWSGIQSVKSAFPNDIDFAYPAPANPIFHNGAIYIPCMIGKDHVWYSGICHNVDGVWTFSPCSPTEQDNECTIYTYDGKIFLNCRNDRGGMPPYYRSLYEYRIDTNDFVEIFDFFKPYARCQSYIKAHDGYLFRSFPNASGYLGKDGGFYARKNNTLWVSKDNEQWSPVAQITEVGGYTTFAISEDKLYYMYEDAVGGDCSMAIIDDISTLINNAIGEVGISLADKL